MIVYGDQERGTTVAAQCDRIAAALAEVSGSGLAWHGAVARLLIEVAGLLQGVADLEMAAAGGLDEGSGRQDALMLSLIAIAGALQRSWATGLAEQSPPVIDLCASTDEPIRIRRPEGVAYYALYPELHAEAARVLGPETRIIGLRSIGTVLAPVVAAACGADMAMTLRPVGHPFGRAPAVGATLADRLGTDPVAIVDEGPGMSGSSLLGTVDWLGERGVGPERISLLPSHAGPPGSAASPAHQARWASLSRHVADFDEVIVNGRVPLARWFEDLTGPASAPLEDIAGGRWRDRSPDADLPAHPGREPRKWRLVTAGGVYRIKFVGLDADGVELFARAQRLAGSGLIVAPIALRYGMMLEPWVAARAIGLPPTDRVDRLSSYFGARAALLPATAAGASLTELAKMARFNLATVIRDAAATRLLARWRSDRLARLQKHVRPIHIDGRLHGWEWLQAGDRVVKTDAVEHSHSHDLIGPQDVAWDIAGAIVEHGLDDTEAAHLTATLGASAELVEFLHVAYLAFQLGWWSETEDPHGRAQAGRYAAAAVRLAAN